jgi:hypothetical protein
LYTIDIKTRPDEYYESNNLIEPNVEEVNNLFKNKESFAAFVYTPGCVSCAEFEKVTNEFRNNYNIVFYHIKSEIAKETKIHEKVMYSPSAILVKDGKIVSYLDATSNKDLEYYKTMDNFKNWLEKNIYIEK